MILGMKDFDAFMEERLGCFQRKDFWDYDVFGRGKTELGRQNQGMIVFMWKFCQNLE